MLVYSDYAAYLERLATVGSNEENPELHGVRKPTEKCVTVAKEIADILINDLNCQPLILLNYKGELDFKLRHNVFFGLIRIWHNGYLYILNSKTNQAISVAAGTPRSIIREEMTKVIGSFL